MTQDSWYQGRRSEIIADYLLSNIAFTVPVVARSDIGVDLFCTLYRFDADTKNRSLEPTSMFTIQIKSKNNTIVLTESNVDYLGVLEVPYFIGIVDRENQSLDIYSCQQFLQFFQKFGGLKRSEKFEIELRPVEQYSQMNKENNLDILLSNNYPQFENLLSDLTNPFVKQLINKKDSITRVILEIGPKIIQIKANETEEKARDELTNNLLNWIKFEYENKYNKETYVPFHKLRFYTGEETDVGWYHEGNYGLNVYYRLAIRLAMLFIYYSKDVNRLREHKEVIKNSKELVELTLTRIDKNTYFGDLYYKKLEKAYEQVTEKIKNLTD